MLVTTGMQIRAIARYSTNLLVWQQLKRLAKPTIAEKVEKIGTLTRCWWEHYNRFEKHFDSFLKSETYDQAIPLLGIYPKEL